MQPVDRPPGSQSDPKPSSGRRYLTDFNKIRAQLNSRAGRIIVAFAVLLLGIVFGIGATLLYALAISGNGRMLAIPPARTGNIVVQADSSFLAHLVEKHLRSAGLPGEIKNVRVQLAHGDQMTIAGDDEISMLGVGVTRYFTIEVQPYVSACQLQVHVIHASLGGIPVTGFVSSFESQINLELRTKPTGLPAGFIYCTVGVRTEPAGLFVLYTATPV